MMAVRRERASVRNDGAMPPPVELEVSAPFAGVVVAIEQTPGALVQAGEVLVVLEAMKMEHEVLAESDGIVQRVEVAAGDAIEAGELLVVLRTDDRVANGAREDGALADVEFGGARKGGAFVDTGFGDVPDGASRAETTLDEAPGGTDPRAARAARGSDASGAAGNELRADLAAVHARHALGLDAARPQAVERRRERGRRTARENLEELVDEGSYVEYGPLLFAAQERRRSKQELIERTPADGLVAGVAEIDGNPCVAMSYDYTVLAGTQGMRGHLKKDRLFEVAERRRLPVVLFAEGGGGRPGDVDFPIVAGLDCRAFHLFGRLSGLVPLVGIASGYCFAGNAALLGCCDVVIATEDSSIGMGGPAMIEGGGLGVFEPGEVGPIDVQHTNGVVDLRVADDRAAVAAAKRYLSYFQGPVEEFTASDGMASDENASDLSVLDRSSRGWSAPDQSLLREIVPEQRKRAYVVRKVLHGLCDEDSVLELRDGFGAGMVTALARIEGKSLGIVANDPSHLGGAIDADAADKAARFLQLCDAFGLPVLFLCDTPGFMVGPDAERTATVRHFSRLFTIGANLEIPFGTIVLRKGYGLGAQAMAGGSFKAPLFCVGWPTSEFGGMGLEGAVRLGMRRELDAIEDPQERERIFQATVAAAYEQGEGLNMAAHGEIDDVIDPADSRRWIATLFDPPVVDWRKRAGKRRPNIDAW
jgi:acetyl-CoA carboxylase carboxyltransferase component